MRIERRQCSKTYTLAPPSNVTFAAQKWCVVFFYLHRWRVGRDLAFEEAGRVVFDLAGHNLVDVVELGFDGFVASEAYIFLVAVGSLKALAPKGAVRGARQRINAGLPLSSVRGAERIPLEEVTMSPSWYDMVGELIVCVKYY